MTIDWASIWTNIVNACAWMVAHPAEAAATVAFISSWFGFNKKLKEDAAIARARLRFDRLRQVGEFAYGQAAFEARKADGTKTNKLAAALEAADRFLQVLGEDTASEHERTLLTGLFTAKHESETVLASTANPTASPSVGC